MAKDAANRFLKLWERDRDDFPFVKQLVEEIDKRFDPKDDIADLSILYEMTGYQGLPPEPEFWKTYEEFQSQVQKQDEEEQEEGEEQEGEKEEE